LIKFYQPSERNCTTCFQTKTINIIIVDEYLINKEVVGYCSIERFGGETEKKTCLPSFISNPTGMLLRLLKQKRSTMDKQITLLVRKTSLGTVSFKLKDLAGKTEKKIRLPSFFSHPNGIVLRV